MTVKRFGKLLNLDPIIKLQKGAIRVIYKVGYLEDEQCLHCAFLPSDAAKSYTAGRPSVF